MDANITGLSAREVTERRERGEGGAAAERITKDVYKRQIPDRSE